MTTINEYKTMIQDIISKYYLIDEIITTDVDYMAEKLTDDTRAYFPDAGDGTDADRDNLVTAVYNVINRITATYKRCEKTIIETIDRDFYISDILENNIDDTAENLLEYAGTDLIDLYDGDAETVEENGDILRIATYNVIEKIRKTNGGF